MTEPNPLSRDPDLRPLRRDLRLLTFELSRALERLAPEALRPMLDRVHGLAVARRSDDADADAALRRILEQADVTELDGLARSASLFFDLANLAEDRHRLRELRRRERRQHPHPLSESVGEAVRILLQRHTPDEVAAMIPRLDIELVATAHPTEAKRRTVRNTLRRLRADLVSLDDRDLLPRERLDRLQSLRVDMGCLWETDSVRQRKPTVLDEVDRGMVALDTLWDAAPRITRDLRDALQAGGVDPPERLRPLRFATWIGGDRDGNPNVTAEVTEQTLRRLRRRALELHLDEARRLRNVLTMSQVVHQPSDDFIATLYTTQKQLGELAPEPEDRREIYRWRLDQVIVRLELAIHACDGAAPRVGAYQSASSLDADLMLLAESLRETGHRRLADGPVQTWRDRVAIFGLHMARLDIRDHSKRLHEAIRQLVEALTPDQPWEGDPAAIQRVLLSPIDPRSARLLDAQALPEPAASVLDLFDRLQSWADAFGDEGLGATIVSMTHHPIDVMTVLWLQRLAATRGTDDGVAVGRSALRMPIAPLFETIDDLRRAPDMLRALLAEPAWREHVEAGGGEQICMIGYSDSTKDGGYLAGAWRLYAAQRGLAEIGREAGVEVAMFHGRGGSLARGGGPAARGIMALPPEAVRGRLRVTEQGEVLAERYDHRDLAHRHLEQVTNAVLQVLDAEATPPPAAWADLLERAAALSRTRYRRLVEDPAFIDYFAAATPIRVIEQLPIGSRPSRRSASERLDDLRAIPFTFAWNQNRHMLTTVYGIGSGLEEAAGGDRDLLREMYQNWPVFRSLIDMVELALVRTDDRAIRAYAELPADREAARRIADNVIAEIATTRRVVLHTIGRSEPLEGVKWLARSVALRQPFLDVLNLIQVELLKRRFHGPDAESSADDPEARRLDRALRHTVQGLAAGLRTTG